MRAASFLVNLIRAYLCDLVNAVERMDRELAGEPVALYTRRWCTFRGRPCRTAWAPVDYHSGYPTKERYYNGVHDFAEGVDMVVGRLDEPMFRGVQFKIIGLRSRRVVVLGKGKFPKELEGDKGDRI